MTELSDSVGENVDVEMIEGPPWQEFMEWSKQMRRSQFIDLGAPPRHVLFLGDSITEQCLWSEWFPHLPTLNRGIAGDTIADLTSRLDTAINDPIAISLLIGTNDLGGGFPGYEQPLTDPRQIADSFAGLVSEIRDRVPDVPLLINSVMPREERFTPNILALNEDYRQIAERAKAHYVDLWPHFADGEVIKSEYSRDLLHLNGPGYRAWTSLLAPILEALIGQRGSSS